jgi:predicted RNA binding protein YcfA (HicA-like mRNA interferase family)
MPPSSNSREIIKRLVAEGWVKVRQKGSHAQYKKASVGLVTVPHPKKSIPVGTLRSIYRQAGWVWSGTTH